jgi:hypothetical protein
MLAPVAQGQYAQGGFALTNGFAEGCGDQKVFHASVYVAPVVARLRAGNARRKRKRSVKEDVV